MFAVENLSVSRSGRSVLSGVSALLQPGRLTAIVGPNGAGKSTLLNALAGTLPPSRGRVELDGRLVSEWPRTALARRRAVLAQNTGAAFPFTVYEVVSLGSSAAGVSAANRRLVVDCLTAVGLAGFSGRLFQHLSGGEQQRTQIARVLCQIGGPDAADAAEPRWLLLDEPTAGLDIPHQLAILDIAARLTQNGGGTVAVLHDLNLASLYAERVLVLSEGRLVADGVPEDVLRSSVVSAVFGDRLKTIQEDGRLYVVPVLGAASA